MAKPRKSEGTAVELFPFLSVLACIIGVLILLIALLAIMQMESGPEQDLVERAEEYLELEKKQEELSKVLDDLLPRLGSLEDKRAELEQLKKDIEDLKRRKEEQDKRLAAASKNIKELAEEQKELEKQLKQELAKQELLDKELEKLREELQRRRMVSEAPTVTIEPAETGPGQVPTNPVFVEANGEGIVLDPAGKREVVPMAKIRSDKKLQNMLDILSGKYDRPIVVLVREDGATAFATMHSHGYNNNVVVTKLPLIGKGMIDLSKF